LVFDGGLERFYGKTGLHRATLAAIERQGNGNSTPFRHRGIQQAQQPGRVADPADPAPAPDLAATAAAFRT